MDDKINFHFFDEMSEIYSYLHSADKNFRHIGIKNGSGVDWDIEFDDVRVAGNSSEILVTGKQQNILYCGTDVREVIRTLKPFVQGS